MTAAFDPAEAAFIKKTGTGKIAGHAFWRDGEGGTINAAGEIIRLVPATAYARERFAALYGGTRTVAASAVRKFAADPAYEDYTRTTRAESNGRFEFDNLAPGTYFVTAQIVFRDKHQYMHFQYGSYQQRPEDRDGRGRDVRDRHDHGEGKGNRQTCADQRPMSNSPAEPPQSQVKLLLVVAVALIDADGRILISQRPAGKALGGLWEFPGGKVKPGETPEVALIRELREELGIVVEAPCLAPLTFASHGYEAMHLLMPLYVCRRWTGFATPREGQALRWVAVHKLRDFPMPPADAPLIPALLELLG